MFKQIEFGNKANSYCIKQILYASNVKQQHLFLLNILLCCVDVLLNQLPLPLWKQVLLRYIYVFTSFGLKTEIIAYFNSFLDSGCQFYLSLNFVWAILTYV